MKHKFISIDNHSNLWKVSSSKSGKSVRNFKTQQQAIAFLFKSNNVLTYEVKSELDHKWRLYVIEEKLSKLEINSYKDIPRYTQDKKTIVKPKKVVNKTKPKQKVVAKKVEPKKAAPKKVVVKKATPKKVVATKVEPKKVVNKTKPKQKVVAKKVEPKKAAPKKVVVKKATPKKVVVKTKPKQKVVAKKVEPKKAAPKKVVVKKATPKKVVVKTKPKQKVVAKKVEPKKAAPKKVVVKKATPKKVVATKVEPKKVVNKTKPKQKVVAKKVEPKKAAPKKVVVKKATPKKVVVKTKPKQKVVAKKVEPKKVAPKKVVVKTTPKQTVEPKKVVVKKATPKKSVAKKVEPKKAAPKKVVVKTTPKQTVEPKKVVVKPQGVKQMSKTISEKPKQTETVKRPESPKTKETLTDQMNQQKSKKPSEQNKFGNALKLQRIAIAEVRKNEAMLREITDEMNLLIKTQKVMDANTNFTTPKIAAKKELEQAISSSDISEKSFEISNDVMARTNELLEETKKTIGTKESILKSYGIDLDKEVVSTKEMKALLRKSLSKKNKRRVNLNASLDNPMKFVNKDGKTTLETKKNKEHKKMNGWLVFFSLMFIISLNAIVFLVLKYVFDII